MTERPYIWAVYYDSHSKSPFPVSSFRLTESLSKTHGVTSYGRRLRKNVGNQCLRCACDDKIRAGDGNVAGDPISGQAIGAEENTTHTLSLSLSPSPHPPPPKRNSASQLGLAQSAQSYIQLLLPKTTSSNIFDKFTSIIMLRDCDCIVFLCS